MTSKIYSSTCNSFYILSVSSLFMEFYNSGFVSLFISLFDFVLSLFKLCANVLVFTKPRGLLVYTLFSISQLTNQPSINQPTNHLAIQSSKQPANQQPTKQTTYQPTKKKTISQPTNRANNQPTNQPTTN